MSYQKLLSIMEELQHYAEQGMPIIIEGKKDEKSLKELGIEGNFIKVSGSPYKLFEIAEIAAQSSKIIILTDFDKKGNELAQKLSEDIQRLGSYPNLQIRRRIMGITRRYIKDIESLSRHLHQLELEEYPYGVTGDYYLECSGSVTK
ncbi:MAG TPA: toprim domain-containing protein [Methanobacterium sp.]|nr:toprim domain-containing protein [Methanobacterium sp.]